MSLYTNEERYAQPSGSRILFERTPTDLTIHVPARGMRFDTWAALIIMPVWLGWLTKFTLEGGIGNAVNDAITLLVTVSFWLIGLTVVVKIVASARSTYSVYLDSRQLVANSDFLGWKKKQVVRRWQVQSAKERNFQRKGTIIDRFVQIVYQDGLFEIPCDSVQEQRWLVGEINEFLQSDSNGQ